jgi:hypothetical protein
MYNVFVGMFHIGKVGSDVATKWEIKSALYHEFDKATINYVRSTLINEHDMVELKLKLEQLDML